MNAAGLGERTDDRAAAALAERYARVRQFTERLREPLSAEDCMIQSMPDASPTRWHLAHTTWFFETFVLAELSGYRVFHPQFNYLFNSYYNTVGAQFPRPQRGLISRPGIEEIEAYRRSVDEQMLERLRGGGLSSRLLAVVEVGLHHEQQHQELILTDIKHALSCNPLWPVYRTSPVEAAEPAKPLKWVEYAEGVYSIGHEGSAFAFDNESPRHRVYLERFELANRPVTCREFMEFIDDGGYRRPELWLSAGWQTVQERSWQAPLYWMQAEGRWQIFTLAGLRELAPGEPLCHVSYYEAEAFAAWSGARLPTEAEWEVAAEGVPLEGHFADELLDAGLAIHPRTGAAASGRPGGLFGDVWEWTSSAYSPYPGFRALDGALGEYNGKFMCNQYVLRGGSCATSRSHIRPTYRNFFAPDARWQFSGIRLAR